MSCEECKYFDEAPYRRDGDYNDYCDIYNKRIACIEEETGIYCKYFKENDEY